MPLRRGLVGLAGRLSRRHTCLPMVTQGWITPTRFPGSTNGETRCTWESYARETPTSPRLVIHSPVEPRRRPLSVLPPTPPRGVDIATAIPTIYLR